MVIHYVTTQEGGTRPHFTHWYQKCSIQSNHQTTRNLPNTVSVTMFSVHCEGSWSASKGFKLSCISIYVGIIEGFEFCGAGCGSASCLFMPKLSQIRCLVAILDELKSIKVWWKVCGIMQHLRVWSRLIYTPFSKIKSFWGRFWPFFTTLININNFDHCTTILININQLWLIVTGLNTWWLVLSN